MQGARNNLGGWGERVNPGCCCKAGCGGRVTGTTHRLQILSFEHNAIPSRCGEVLRILERCLYRGFVHARVQDFTKVVVVPKTSQIVAPSPIVFT